MKKNVLIFGGGGYNAIQVYFALKDTLRFYPILASSGDNHSTYVSNDAIIDLPYDYEVEFIPKLNECIDKYNIEFIIPTHDTAAFKLMENQKEINATIVCSSLETTKICRYKSLTYDVLKQYSFIPKVYSNKSDINFPVFVKDDIGQGGKNAFLIRDKEGLERLDKSINYVWCEYLPGEEITIDCFTDRKGVLRFVQPRTRERILNGISARSQNIEVTDEIFYIANSINSTINFRGYWFIQCKKDILGKYKLMEISTRFAGTFALSKNLDVNLPLLALSDFSDMDIDIKPNTYKITADKMYIDRYKVDINYEKVYIDFDDTLVFNREKYNTEAMRFLYQCLNKGKKIILITKHEYDIRQTLKKIRLNEELFSEIICVPIDDYKYKYIDNLKPAIFIDNAYTERRLVKENLGISTFDVTNIESLIDWCD